MKIMIEGNTTDTREVLEKVGDLIKTHKEVNRAKGEDFNLFAIMGMEHNETKTHSAIIAALINPKGDHYKDERFLKLFLDQINYNYEKENLKNTKIHLEFHLGKIDKDYSFGGFIDILIEFGSGKTIAIENKIYAQDQYRQIYRYSQYNEKRNKVYYLNLFGNKPDPESYCLLGEEGFEILSYKEHINDWLSQCMEHCIKGSILYTSILQYHILIKKLTYSMDKTQENELNNIIINNIEAGKYIRENYDTILNSIREKFRQQIITKLREALPPDQYLIIEGNKPDTGISQIFIQLKDAVTKEIEFGVEVL